MAGKGKILIFAALVPLVIGGAVVGLGLKGIIKIPGLTPVKKAVKKADATKDAKKQSTPTPAPTPTPKVVAKAKPKPKFVTDPSLGAKKVAGIWNEMDPAQLVPIMATYKDQQLATVMEQMDPDQVAAVLALMKPTQAASISKELATLSSIKPEPSSQGP